MSNITISYTKKKRKRSGSLNLTELPPDTCIFCRSNEDSEDDYGKIIRKCGFTVHYFCMLFASGLSQGGKTESQGILGFMPGDIRREIGRGNRLRCTYCKDKGATIGCVISSCRRAFHLTCGIKKGSLHQFFDSFRSYCPEHRPRQVVQTSDRLAFVGTANTTCSICMYSVVARSSNDTLRAPCCKNSWFHRSCIQRYALSAGLYFFKCPLCNSKDTFQTEMLQYGIYIPDQDAAWEREPNAFQDLYERYSHCDAAKCKCPNGRDYDEDDTKWEIIVCEQCGSKGSHSECKGLKMVRKDYLCADCEEIDKKTRGTKYTKKKAQPVRQKTQEELQELLKKRVEDILAQKGSSEKKNTEAESQKEKTPPITAPLTKRGTTMSRRSTTRAYSSLGEPDVCYMHKTDTDTEVDIEASESEEEEQNSKGKDRRKKRRLSLSVTKSNSKKKSASTVSSNVEVHASGDSCSASIQTKTLQGKYSNYVTVSTVTNNDVRQWGSLDYNSGETDSSSRQTSFLNYCQSEDSSSSCSSDLDSDSEICAVDEVHEDSSKKTVTIKWKGKKIRIFKEVEKDDREDISKWSLHLEVGDSDELMQTRTPTSNRNPSKDSPPQLVPIDDEISIRCTPPTRPYMLNMNRQNEGYNDSNKSLRPYGMSEESQAESRVTRSMSTDSKKEESKPNSVSTVSDREARHSRRSLERAFTYQEYCRTALSNRIDQIEDEFTDSPSNSVITLSSNASDKENSDEESDCLILEPVYVTSNQKSVRDGRVSYSAQIAVGSPFKDQEYPDVGSFRQITRGSADVGVVIDLTGSPKSTWEGLADT